MPTTSEMTLPSRKECLDRFHLTGLQEGKGTHDAEETCPICLEAQPDVLTPCRHRYCLECLSHWLAYKNTCPNCRSELYEAEDDDLDDEDFNDDETVVYDSIDRLDLGFDVDEDEVTAAVISLRHQNLERSIARSQPIHVNYHALLARSVAGVLHLNPELEDGFTLDDLNRSVWTYVLTIIQHTLSRLQNQTLTCGELWDALDKDIHETFEGSATLRYADDSEGEHEFQHDLFDLFNYVTYEAHGCYSRYHGAHNVHPLRQLPDHFTPLGNPPLTDPFETSESDIADSLTFIAEQDLSNFNLHELDDRELYLSFAQLYPAMLGAIYAIKPNVPPNSEDISDSQHGLQYPQWRSVVHNVSDILFGLHSHKLSAEQLYQTLDERTTEHRGYRYLWTRGAGPTFQDDISSVLRSVVLSAMRFGGVEGLPLSTVDTDMADTDHSE